VKILVIDIGGSHVKWKIWGNSSKKKFRSGKKLTPQAMVDRIGKATPHWPYDAVSIGFPGAIIHGRPAGDPPNLGPGWIHFDYQKAFGKKVRMINDAAMQALGSYHGGRMLFIGLGTGVGSALILDDVIVPLELGELKFSKQSTVAEALGKARLKDVGVRRWSKMVHAVVPRLVAAFRADYVVIGGGNSKHLRRLPPGARRGSNDRAFVGGARLWGVGDLHARPRKHTWTIT
jgi:predicted NBD/HSP70 family sugar kinase